MPDNDEDGFKFRLQSLFDMRYASKDEVKIIRALVFGFVGLILTSVVLGILYGVLNLAH